jgi:serine/threonine protein kinase/WD40 repeat protein
MIEAGLAREVEDGRGNIKDGNMLPEDRSTLPPSFGDYEVMEEIARGGMGVVYKARQISLNRVVAVKMILTGRLAKAADLQRFRAEAEMAARLQHPNIVAIHEVGEFEGQPFFMMDYVEGRSLADLSHNEPLPAKLAAAYLRTIAEAVQYAHSKGVLHRDLKPSNILIDQNDQPRITDFGLAKRLDESALSTPHSPLTVTGQVLGSPNFMPPEQATGDRAAVGTASDVYSLGAILYQLLTGRPPFMAETLTQTLRLATEAEPAAPRLLNPAASPDLETVCLKCLQKDPRRRFSSAQELADELGRFLHGEPIQSRPVGSIERAWNWSRRHPALAALSLAVLVLLLTVATGSALYASRLRAANKLAAEKLRESYFEGAQAQRYSGRPGRRFKALELLCKAAEIQPSTQIRNAVIAALALEDLRTIKEIKNLAGRSIQLDSNFERYIATDDDGSTVVREVNGNRELARIPAPFRNDGCSFGGPHTVSAYYREGTNHLLQIYDLQSNRMILSCSNYYCHGIEFSEDGKSCFVSTMIPTVILKFLLPSGQETEFCRSRMAASLKYSPEGERVAFSDEASPEIQIRDSGSGKLLKTLTNSSVAKTLSWHPNGRLLAAGSADSKIYVWDTETGQIRRVLAGHEGQVIGAFFSSDGEWLASFSWDNFFRLWDTATGRQILSRPAFGGAGGARLSSDGRRIALPTPHSLEICELAGRREWREFNDSDGAGRSSRQCSWSPDGRLLISAHPNGFRLWDVEKGKDLGRIEADLAEGWSSRFSPDGSHLVEATSSGLHLVPLRWQRTNSTIQVIPGLRQRIGSRVPADGVSWTRDGTRVAAVVDGQVQVFEWPGMRPVQVLRPEGGVFGCSLSPSGRLCVSWPSALDQPRQVWEVNTGTLLKELPREGAYAAAFTPDDACLITGLLDQFTAWDTRSWTNTWRIPWQNSGGAHARVTLSADGSLGAMSGSAQTIRLFEPATGRELATLEAPMPHTPSWLEFSPDGTRLAVATQGAGLNVWDLRLIRQELAAMKLDWDAPSLPPAKPSDQTAIEVVLPDQDR